MEIAATKQWINTVVVDLNLCPFAKRELVNAKVRFTLSESTTEQQLLLDLLDELKFLTSNTGIETTLLIHPQVLTNFYDYNDFLSAANGLLVVQGYEGIFQIASFHPDYRFSDTTEDDASNYTNRSPYPMLHILREESLSKAIDAYPNAETIPERNIALMRQMGNHTLHALLDSCFQEAGN